MTEKNKQRALVIIVLIEAIIVAWLLTRRAAQQQAAGNKSYPISLVESPASYTGSPFTLGGMTTNPIDLTILFPGTDPGPAPSCDCGCDANSPLNAATAQLAGFINQYEQGIYNIQKGLIESIAASIPDFMSQYINGGAPLGIGSGGNGGL